VLLAAGRLASMMPDVKYGSGKEPGGSSEPGQAPPTPRESDGWRILSYMLGGMILYGGIGWLVGKWTGISVLFPVGMILGIGLSIVLIVFRVTKT
jgi:ATP synthase protein I